MGITIKNNVSIALSINDRESIMLKCNYDRKMLLNRKKVLMDFIINTSTVEENEIFVKSHDAVINTLTWMN